MRFIVRALLIASILWAAVMTQAPGSSWRLVSDIPYREVKGSSSKLTSLDLYVPQGGKAHPVVVFIHGGGWARGDKSHTRSKPGFFTGEGCLYVTVNYRLSPAVKHPVHAEDVASALAWVYRHSASYGGDEKNIFVMGHSAGAHLAALVSTDEKYLGAEGLSPSILKGTILLDGAGYDIPRQMGTNTARRAYHMYAQAFGEDRKTLEDASPVNHVEKGKAMPSFLIFYVASRSDSKKQSEALAEKIKAAGGAAEAVPAINKTHETINTELGVPGDKPTEAITAFLKKLSGEGSASQGTAPVKSP
ncbi:MAG: alpha/beta hydrolase [Candidatus Eremiobacteraeota bacterium]|nr:alpha/beta hydrolase [Candidatus Eremiobacteraeota bacterium]